MTSTLPTHSSAPLHRRVRWPALLVCMASLAGYAVPGLAQQYKVVGSDGRVTYTDRPPLAAGDKMSPLKTTGPLAGAQSTLPVDVREAAQRYPVTLYGSVNCAPCDAGRQLLQQRGIPYVERSVLSSDDSAMLLQLTGGSELPAITVGAQVVRGWSATGWNSYLDAAGYPKESKLPASYQFATATPLTEQREATQKEKSARLPSLLDGAQDVRRDPPPSNPSGFRF